MWKLGREGTGSWAVGWLVSLVLAKLRQDGIGREQGVRTSEV